MGPCEALLKLKQLDEIEDRTRNNIVRYIDNGQYDEAVKMLNEIQSERARLNALLDKGVKTNGS